MYTLRLSPIPSSDIEKESIRQLIGYYNGIGSFTNSGIIAVQAKGDFNLNGLLLTLTSMKYIVDII